MKGLSVAEHHVLRLTSADAHERLVEVGEGLVERGLMTVRREPNASGGVDNHFNNTAMGWLFASARAEDVVTG